MSELRTDRIIPTAGAPTNGGGAIIQVVSTHLTAAGQFGTPTGGEVIDIGLNVTIDIQSVSNKVLLMGHISHNCDNNQQAHFNLVRTPNLGITTADGGIVTGDPGPGTQWRTFVTAQANQDHLDNWAIVTTPFYYLDSPGVRGPTTYKMKLVMGTSNTGKYCWINRGERDEAQTHYDGRASSNITAMEVCA